MDYHTANTSILWLIRLKTISSLKYVKSTRVCAATVARQPIDLYPGCEKHRCRFAPLFFAIGCILPLVSRKFKFASSISCKQSSRFTFCNHEFFWVLVFYDELPRTISTYMLCQEVKGSHFSRCEFDSVVLQPRILLNTCIFGTIAKNS